MGKNMFEEEPTVLDESDPKVQHELYKTMQVMGLNQKNCVIRRTQSNTTNG